MFNLFGKKKEVSKNSEISDEALAVLALFFLGDIRLMKLLTALFKGFKGEKHRLSKISGDVNELGICSTPFIWVSSNSSFSDIFRETLKLLELPFVFT